MHTYGEENVDWEGIDEASTYIAIWLRRYVRLNVTCYKEKFGTVRVYCSLGFSQFYTIFHPGYHYIKSWWPNKLDRWISYKTPLLRCINWLVVPIQKKAYAWRYKKAVQRWPHLYKEITCAADYPELFNGTVPGFKT